MTQAIAHRTPNEIQEGKRPLVMKSGLVHWLSEETATKIERMLAEQTAHGFIRINELGITINSAEIGDGVLTIQQYHDLQKKKQGMWQCEEGNWHEKKHRECTCRADRLKSERLREDQQRRQEENRPLTPEEHAANQERLKKAGEIMVLKKVLPHVGRTIRRSTILEWLEQGNQLPYPEEALKIDEDVL